MKNLLKRFRYVSHLLRAPIQVVYLKNIKRNTKKFERFVKQIETTDTSLLSKSIARCIHPLCKYDMFISECVSQAHGLKKSSPIAVLRVSETDHTRRVFVNRAFIEADSVVKDLLLQRENAKDILITHFSNKSAADFKEIFEPLDIEAYASYLLGMSREEYMHLILGLCKLYPNDVVFVMAYSAIRSACRIQKDRFDIVRRQADFMIDKR